MNIKITKTSGKDWYATSIGCVYKVEREGKDFYLVRRPYGKLMEISKENAEVVG